MKKINYIREEELEQLHDNLADIFANIIKKPAFDLSYMVRGQKNMKEKTLENISAYLLSCIANRKDGHPFSNLNEMTAYFATKYFLMKNGADYKKGYKEVSEEIENIAKKPDLESAYIYAKKVCEGGIIIKNEIGVKNYENFYELVIKKLVWKK